MRNRARSLTLALLLIAFGASFGATGFQFNVPTARGATTLELCGRVNAFVEPQLLATGLLTVGPSAFIITAGAEVVGDVDVGADLCLRLTLNGGGSITKLVVVEANATATVRICGEVMAFVEATASKTGSLKIGHRTFTVAVGADLPASVDVGADICAELEINGFGHVQGADVQANVTSTLRICGEVTAFAEAGPTSTGNLTIGGRKLTIAMGADLPAQVHVGADLCAELTLNAFGQIQDGDVEANVTTTVRVCGVVSAFADATATKAGSLRIGGRTFAVAIGADIPAQVRAGADLCLTLELNAFAQIQDCQATANVTTSLTVCGEVTAYAAASATQSGHLTVGNASKSIAPGTEVAASVKVGAFVKLRLDIDVFGRVSKVTVLKVAASLAAACDGAPTPTPSPTPDPSPSPTPVPGPSPSPTPVPGPSPTPVPVPGPSPTPTPVPEASPTPSPTPTPIGVPGPTPSPTPGGPGGPGGPGDGGEVCPPSGSTHAPSLDADASPVERVGSLMAGTALPFGLFALGMLAAGLLGRWRRERSLEAQAGGEDDAEPETEEAE